MIWFALFVPFLGALMAGCFGRVAGGRRTGILASAAVLVSFLTFLSLFWQGASFDATLFAWLHVGGLTIPVAAHVDSLMLLMALTVTGVGFLIHVYSIGYMAADPHVTRYFAYLNLFVFFMLVLISSANMLFLFLGWEGVGLCSYLLISFWMEKPAAADAGKKAFLVNRVGDFGFLLGMFLMIYLFGTLTISEVVTTAHDVLVPGSFLVTVLTLLFFWGAVGKSAQFPLYVWLPDAMEGPTPVSALIHAATMVTAGVYLVARLFPLFAMAPVTLLVMAVIGVATAFFAALLAMVQSDIKRVLAYSTISQLGYMVAALGFAAPVAAVFHLMTHAFFKALLFLGAGSVIHGLGGEQNLWKMGNLWRSLRGTAITFLIAWLAIIGLPPFAGFFSKDEILLAAYAASPFLWFWLWLGAGLTAFYMTRLVALVFFRPATGATPQPAHESPLVMLLPLGVLAFFSVVVGWVGWPTAEGSWIHHFLAPSFHASHGMGHGKGGVPSGISLALASIFIVFLGVVVGWFLFKRAPQEKEPIAPLVRRGFRFLKSGYHLDTLYHRVFVQGGKWLSALAAVCDRHVVDAVVNGVAGVVLWVSARLHRWQSGRVRTYAFSFSIGMLVVVALLLHWHGFWKGFF